MNIDVLYPGLLLWRVKKLRESLAVLFAVDFYKGAEWQLAACFSLTSQD